MAKDEKTTSLAAAVLLLSGVWFGMCADARAEATKLPNKALIPRYKTCRRSAIAR